MDAEAEIAIRALAAALHQASVRVCGVMPEIGPYVASTDDMTPTPPPVTNSEAAEFVEIINTFVSATSDPVSKQHLLFNVNPKLLPCIVSFVQSPQLIITPGDGTGQLMLSSLQCLIAVVCACCTDHLAAAGDEPPVGPAERNLSAVTCDVLMKHNLVHSVITVLNPIFPEDVQRCAAELLFALLLRSAKAKEALVRSKSLSILYASLSEQASPKMRAYIAACVRELANSHSAFMADIEALDLLNRLHALDESSDVRALAAETLDVLFRLEPAAWATCPRWKELAAACVARLEADPVTEVVQATLKLVETALVADGQLRNTLTEATFTDYFVANFGDRILVALMEPGTRIGSLCARNLRLLVQNAPHYRYVAFGLHQHFPSISKMTKLTVQLATDPNMKDVVAQIMKVELAMALALTLAQDSRCRQLLSSQLYDHPQWAFQLRTATLSNLNGAALDYFSGLRIIDATGKNLCALGNVEWEAGGRPTRDSIQQLLLDQEERWNHAASAEDGLQPAAGPDGEEAGSDGADAEVRSQRLAFIVLSFSVHTTLGAGKDMTTAAPAGPSAPPAEEDAMPRDAASFNATPGQPQATPNGGTYIPAATGGSGRRSGGNASGATRTSLMRLFNSHPEKLAAVQRHQQLLQQGSGAGDAAAAKTPSYTASNFVDPLRQPTADSFKQPRGGSVGSTGKAASPTRALFSKFDHALKLSTTFAQFYDKPSEPAPIVYETTEDGFVRRVPSSSVATTQTSRGGAPAGRRGGGAATVMGGGDGSRSWTIQQLKAGDLFFFAIPLGALDASAVEHVRARAIRHLATIKKAFIVTPQVAKARRWFLFDMSNHIMPAIVHTLSQLMELFALHGEEAVKFPLLMFREGNSNASGVDASLAAPGGAAGTSAADIDGVASLHSGNLVESINQVRFYFSKVSERRGPNAATDLFSTKRKSTYLEDLERKMGALSSMQFTGANSASRLAAHDNDDDDDAELAQFGVRRVAGNERGGSTARVLSNDDY